MKHTWRNCVNSDTVALCGGDYAVRHGDTVRADDAVRHCDTVRADDAVRHCGTCDNKPSSVRY